jgi:hypothetical protein
MLVLIGKNLGGLDAQNSAHLPSGWNTLYFLARLEGPVLENLILDGIVHPGLTLNEAKELLAKFKEPKGGKAPRSTFRQRFKKFQDFIQTNLPVWNAEERDWARSELLRLADQLTAREKPSRPLRALSHPMEEGRGEGSTCSRASRINHINHISS